MTRLVRSENELDDLLAAIARAISSSLGFATVAVHLYRPAWDDFVVTTVHGGAEACERLMGDARERTVWEPLLQERFLHDGAYLIPHGEIDWETLRARVVRARGRARRRARELAPRGRPVRAAAPLRRPPDRDPLGRRARVGPARPTSEELEILVAMADHAAIAVQSAQEAAAAARHRAALEQLLAVSSRLTETFSIDAILQSVCDAIRTALEFENVCVDLPDPETGAFRSRAASGWEMTDDAVAVPMALAELERLLQPEFEIEGCHLIEYEEVMRRVGAEHDTYQSRNNGRGPAAWRNHWLLVPLWSRGGAADGRDLGRRPDRPPDPLRRQAAVAARLREPGDHRARHRRAVRGDAVPGRARPAHPPLQPARVHRAAGPGGVARRRATATRCRSCCAT